MCARLVGKSETPNRVVELLKEEVAKTSQAATARATGLPLRGVQNYLKAIGEPTQASLEKLANYFEVSVAWLRGEPWAGKHGGVDLSQINNAKPIALCAKCGEELQASSEGFYEVMQDGKEREGDGILRLWPCEKCCKS